MGMMLVTLSVLPPACVFGLAKTLDNEGGVGRRVQGGGGGGRLV